MHLARAQCEPILAYHHDNIASARGSILKEACDDRLTPYGAQCKARYHVMYTIPSFVEAPGRDTMCFCELRAFAMN